MKKFWSSIFSCILLILIGCQTKETQTVMTPPDDSEELEEMVAETIKAYDENKDGKLDAEELKNFFATIFWLNENDQINAISKVKTAVVIPPFDPVAISKKAMELYDSNGDEQLDAVELEACPGMLFSLKSPKSIDTNSNGMIDESEIQARIQAWIDMQVGITCPSVKFIDSQGKIPYDVIGKRVILTPDPVHEGILKTTIPVIIDEKGECLPTTPGNIDGLIGLSYGFYTITIENTPYKNLGVEIYDGAKEEESYSFNIKLKK